jgi:hypothetical protein
VCIDETRFIVNSDLGTASRLLIKPLRKVYYCVSICLYCSSWIAIVMDLYGRRIVGWQTSKRMTADLIEQAFLKAHSLRQPPKGLVLIQK